MVMVANHPFGSTGIYTAFISMHKSHTINMRMDLPWKESFVHETLRQGLISINASITEKHNNLVSGTI